MIVAVKTTTMMRTTTSPISTIFGDQQRSNESWLPLCMDYWWHVSNTVTLLWKHVFGVTNMAGIHHLAGHHHGTAASMQIAI